MSRVLIHNHLVRGPLPLWRAALMLRALTRHLCDPSFGRGRGYGDERVWVRLGRKSYAVHVRSLNAAVAPMSTGGWGLYTAVPTSRASSGSDQ